MESKGIREPTVLIACAVRLFGDVLERLLRQQGGVDVLGIEENTDRVLESIESLRPDVVVVDEATLEKAGAALMLNLVGDVCPKKVICLHTSDNRVEVYQKQQVEVKRREELLQVIQRS